MHLVAKRAGELEGVAGWVITAWRGWTSQRRTPRRHMRVVETLMLGAKNKLVLVSCEGERYLVGTGPDSVGTIVRVRDDRKGLGLVREIGS